MAAGAVTVSFVFGSQHRAGLATSRRQYVCPMHPEVTSSGSGECPICRMALELADGVESTPNLGAAPSRFDIARLRTFNQEIRAPAWVEARGLVLAVFYKDEVEPLGRAESISFCPAKNGSAKVQLHLARDPIVPWDGSTSLVSFRFEPSTSVLGQG